MRYLGSKDKLLPAIHALLHEKGLLDQSYTFFDAFCGTGAVANSVKDFYKLIINDSMQWSIQYRQSLRYGLPYPCGIPQSAPCTASAPVRSDTSYTT